MQTYDEFTWIRTPETDGVVVTAETEGALPRVVGCALTEIVGGIGRAGGSRGFQHKHRSTRTHPSPTGCVS
jgi:hypothetical protein